MKVESNKQLKNLNTFKVNVVAKNYVEVEKVSQLKKSLSAGKKVLILGGGANILFVNNIFNGLVIKINIKGKRVIKETKTHKYLKFGAGENWDKCVRYAVNLSLGGIENLGLIPGTAGGAAVQNIAAYNQNLQDTFYSLTAINKKTGKKKIFNKDDCRFTYRGSRFKKPYNNWVVTDITLKLNTNPKVDANYYERGLNKTSLQSELELTTKPPYSVKDIYNAVVSLRTKRIPSEKDYPNPGSFFRNPIVTKQQFNEIKKDIDTLQGYPTTKLKYKKGYSKSNVKRIKISYGQLIDLGLGLKGYKKGNVGIHPKHAAFIYSNGKATGKEIYAFSQDIKQKIYDKYGIVLKEEVKVIH